MVRRQVRFDDTCEIIGIKNDISVIGEILKFRDKDVIIATIKRSAKVTLRWNERAQVYIGSIGDVEFRSSGPKALAHRTY